MRDVDGRLILNVDQPWCAKDAAAPAKPPYKMRSERGGVLRPVRPNVGLEADYRRKLQALVDEMNASLVYWLKASYRSNEPLVAQDDAMPATALRNAMRRLARQWQRRFDAAAPALAEYFAKAVTNRSDAALRSILKKGGISVEFKMTPAARDIMQATINQQVSLIRSIPSQYLTNVEGLVMRSVQTGRDLGQLTKDLQDQYGVTHRRAANIARSQNNIATASMVKARQLELGLVKAKWRHPGAGKHPRPEHVAFSGKEYDIAKGAFLEGKWTWPGVEPGCHCISQSIIPGFS